MRRIAFLVASAVLVPLVASSVPAGGRAAEPGNMRWESILPGETVSVLGRKVVNPEGEVIGRVVDVLFDATGQPRAAVIDFGGFLGMGSRKIAVDWQLMSLRPQQREAPLLAALDKADLQGAPEYKADVPQPMAMIGPSPGTAPTTTNAGE